MRFLAIYLLCSQIPVQGPPGWQQCPTSRAMNLYSESGELTARWDAESQAYRTYCAATKDWSEPTAPPWTKAPRMGTLGTDGRTHYGVEMPPGAGPKGGFTVNGEPTGADDVLQRLGPPGNPAGPAPRRVYLIGAEAVTAPKVSELRDALAAAGLVAGYLVQAKPADHWWSTQAGFAAGKELAVYVQEPDGRVIHRQEGWDGGAAAIVEALRRPRTGNDPARMPDLRRIGRFVPPVTPKQRRGLGIALTAATAAFLFRRRK